MKLKKTILSCLLISTLLTSQIFNLKATAITTESTVTQYMIADKSYISQFVTQEKKKFPNGTYWNSGNTEGFTTNPCVHTGYLSNSCNKFTVNYILAKGYMVFADPPGHNSNPNTFYQCYGFAFKLQSDLFETKSFLQLHYNTLSEISSSGKYEPRIGDHVRINNQSHSIFITSVNNDGTVTYADCNAGNNGCKIQWDQKKSIESLQESSSLYVYRPMQLGDVNGDSVINEADSKLLRDILAEVEPISKRWLNSACRIVAADLSKDGTLNVNDVVCLNRLISGLDTNLYGYVKEE